MVDRGAVDLGSDGCADWIWIMSASVGKIGAMYFYYGHIETRASL